MRQRVAVGMSGGVDSSAAALLLKEAGHEVIGVTMSIYSGGPADAFPPGGPSARPAPDSCYGAGETVDIEDAARVCARLGIPHHVVDLKDDFRKLVIEHTRSEYAAGRTPNPCVRCNRLVKFGLLVEKLAEAAGGVDAFATGHYARLSFDRLTGRWAIRKAADPAKDQSYFLCLLGQEQLGRAIFPLGDLSKSEVRRRAKEAGLEIHDRAESQDFAAGGYRSVVNLPDREGPVTDARGAVIGSHRGHWSYTIGQRRGLGVGGGEVLYVTRIDAASNTVVAGPDADLWHRELVAWEVNWMGMADLAGAAKATEPMHLSVKIRYRNPEASALVEILDGGRVHVTFDEPQRAIAPGQMAVCYDGDRIAFAGVIERAS
jgi:tRNA-specific 2-thiouridylase